MRSFVEQLKSYRNFKTSTVCVLCIDILSRVYFSLWSSIFFKRSYEYTPKSNVLKKLMKIKDQLSLFHDIVSGWEILSRCGKDLLSSRSTVALPKLSSVIKAYSSVYSSPFLNQIHTLARCSTKRTWISSHPVTQFL